MTAREARRMTNKTPPEGTTLFLIGMSMPRLRHAGAWLAVFLAMPRMLVYLKRNPEAGLLSGRLYVGASIMVVSYWRSAEDIRRFAADARAPHLLAWRWFNKRFADRNAVGIWHETYVIGEHETITSGMPPWGLAEAVGAVPVGLGTKTAAQRSRHNVAEMSHSV
ncbi:DUF4188 domain-containing protein [Gordonia polyisoprenivorans]|uniref:DUF4188 domain-containing protein n=1 Tax=Gordonia polyisoprenivorans TaxID=84595 RepID=UPI001AD75DFC|nr:DUF4188 domain-containing protein [Gordonia polyisoprenivorans]QTI68307.1 DUF4188 domain-containing protein [Gordonia polyisoprenivorans]